MADEANLARELALLREYIDFPATPDLALLFRRRQLRHARRILSLRILIACALALVGVAVGASVGAGWLQVRHVGIEILHSPPAVSPTARAIESQLATTGGRKVTLEEARSETGTLPILPRALGLPDSVYIARAGNTDIVYVIYRPRANLLPTADRDVGLLVMEIAPGPDDRVVLEKTLGSASSVETVKVNGTTGYWIQGAQQFVAPASEPTVIRVSSDALIWEQAGILIRLEVAVPKDQALAIAGSIGAN
jgi:hypothetical protein